MKISIALEHLFVLLAVTAMGASASLAAPSVSSTSGTFFHGNTVTITGSSFGTDADEGPVKYDDFDDGEVGSNLSGWSLSASSGIHPAYSDTYSHNGDQCGYANLETQFTCAAYADNLDLTTIYTSHWVRWEKVSGLDSRNKKFARFTSHLVVEDPPKDEFNDGRPIMGYTNFYGDDCGWYLDNGDGYVSVAEDYITSDTWHRVEMYFVASSEPGEADGEWAFWLDSSQIVDEQDYVTIETTAFREFVRTFILPFFCTHVDANDNPEGGPHRIYYDDVYVDSTQARVEIGDASTWSACTHREIQIPSAWSSNSITATVNRGSMSNGTAYLYVVDADGNTNSSGYQITISVPTIYTLTVNSGSGSGTYYENDVANISANPAPSGQGFAEWVGDTTGIASLTSSSTTLTMPIGNAEITATYTDRTWTLTVNSGSGDGSYVVGTVVNISADAAPQGEEFAEWSGDATKIADIYDPTTTITMPYADADITATYDIFYTVHFREGGGSGYDDVTFDDCYVATNDSGPNNGNYAGASNTRTGLIAVKDLFTELPETTDGEELDIRSVVLHLFDYQSKSGENTVYVNRCTSNWMTESAGASEADTSIYYADMSSETQWASGDFSSSDYDASPTVTATWATAQDEEVAIDVTELVEDIYEAEANYGFILTTDTDRYLFWWCSEQFLASRHPSLEIKYRYTPIQYELTVNSGSGDGSYAASTVVDIDADSPPANQKFDEWIGETTGIASLTSASTTLTMPASSAEITATYVDIVTLIVNWGDSAGNNVYDFSDWDSVYLGAYTSYSSDGPDGIVGGSTGKYHTAGVNGSSESFSSGDKIVVTWYNTDASGSTTFTPKISFDDEDYYDGGTSSGTWYDMSQLELSAGSSGTTEYTFDGSSAGSYSRVHVSRVLNNATELLMDKIEYEP